MRKFKQISVGSDTRGVSVKREGGVKVTLLLTRARPRVGVAERERVSERRRGRFSIQ